MKPITRTLAIYMFAAITSQGVGAPAMTSITVSDGRPVWEIARQLQERYGYAITYEDPRYTNEDDLEDVTLQVRKDLDKYPPGKAPQVIGMKLRHLTLAVPDTQSISAPDVAGVLQRLVQLQEAQGTGGRFRVVQTGAMFHIVPTAVRDRNGTWIAQSSILDTPISLAAAPRTPGEMLKAICDAVDAAAHVQIAIVTNFAGIAARLANYTVGADQEPARTVLMRALATVSPNASWVITHDEGRKYFLMITAYPLRTAPGAAQSAAPKQSKPELIPSASR